MRQGRDDWAEAEPSSPVLTAGDSQPGASSGTAAVVLQRTVQAKQAGWELLPALQELLSTGGL